MATDHLLHNGTYYGYPDCCITNFMENFSIKCVTRSEEQKKVAKNGFIPCPSHANQIVKGKVKIEELILPTRKEIRPFSKI